MIPQSLWFIKAKVPTEQGYSGLGLDNRNRDCLRSQVNPVNFHLSNISD